MRLSDVPAGRKILIKFPPNRSSSFGIFTMMRMHEDLKVCNNTKHARAPKRFVYTDGKQIFATSEDFECEYVD